MGEAISDFETWYAWWYSRATFYEDNHLIEVAMTYYRVSLFYLSFSDYRKYEAYKSFRRCFEMYYQPYHLNYFAIPYGKGKLPAIFRPNKIDNFIALSLGINRYQNCFGIKKLNLTHIGVMILLNFVILLKYSNLKNFTTYNLLIQFVNLNNMC